MTNDTLLLRQIHPSFVKDGRPGSRAFRPTKKDNYELSTYDGDMIDAAGSFFHYRKRGLSSAGVCAVAVKECSSESLQVEATPEYFDEHVSIKFEGLSNSQIKNKSAVLVNCAVNRGWQYLDPDSASP